MYDKPWDDRSKSELQIIQLENKINELQLKLLIAIDALKDIRDNYDCYYGQPQEQAARKALARIEGEVK